jgi:3-hydroxyisobutyrate dehydrogenase-like beta-hydroxyacid dehydrogenase
MNANRLGMVGLGLLGTALAERFLRAGYAVQGFDIDPGRRQVLTELGGSWATSAAEVVQGCDRLVFSLPDTPAVERVLEEMAPDLREGVFLVDTTTGDPDRTASLGTALAGRGIRYLDATIAGSSEQVRAGEALVLVGGESSDSEACADLFRCFARQWHHLGPCGSGARMKLVINLVLGLNRAVLAEGLAFARACGLDLDDTLRILQASPAWSRVMDTKGRKMIDRDFRPQARLSQHLKDVRLILAQAERSQAKVPLSTLHRELLERVETAGHGGDDNSAIIRAWDVDPSPDVTGKVTLAEVPPRDS